MKNTEALLKMIAGNADADAKRSVLSSLKEDKEEKVEFNKLKNAWALLASEKEMPSEQLDELYLNFKQQLNLRKHPLKLNSNSFLKYAAVFILAIGLSSILFYAGNRQFLMQSFRYETSVVAENGQRSKIILPDSTVVWLNSGTTISYNNHFALDNREIKLNGQAFFEVTKNKKIPLVVSCNDLKVKVLGTRFDIDAYPENKTIGIALELGSVELLQSENESFRYKLIPGERAQYDIQSGNVKINEVDLDRYTSWKEGILYIKGDSMVDVLTQLERKYNIDIEVTNPEIYQSVFTATIKNESLEEIFKSIEFSCSVHCKIIRGEDRLVKTKIIISK